MTAMNTVLTEFSNSQNSRTSTLTGHTATKPVLVIEKRRVPEGNQTMIEYSYKIVKATTDENGIVLSQKVTSEHIVRYPTAGQADDVAAVLAFDVDITAGDEFANSITTQEWM
jgi:hypothetical protein